MADEISRSTGLPEVLQMLDELPQEIVARAWLKALQAGARVIEQYLIEATPEAEEGNRSGEAERDELPHLVDSTVIEINLDTGLRGGIARIGFGEMGRVALWVEYGHELIGHRPKKKFLGYVRSHPFMTQAAVAATEATIDAFAGALVEVLTSEVPSFAATYAEAGGAVAWFDGEVAMDVPSNSPANFGGAFHFPA